MATRPELVDEVARRAARLVEAIDALILDLGDDEELTTSAYARVAESVGAVGLRCTLLLVEDGSRTARREAIEAHRRWEDGDAGPQ